MRPKNTIKRERYEQSHDHIGDFNALQITPMMCKNSKRIAYIITTYYHHISYQ